MQGLLALAPAEVVAHHRADGSIILTSPRALGDYPRHVNERLRHFAESTPDSAFLAERAEDGALRRVTYAVARERVDRFAQALLDRGLSEDRPLMILSENSVDHALLMLGAMQAGVPVASISAAYSLLSKDFAKLRAIADILRPGLVYVAVAARYARALDALGSLAPAIAVSRGATGREILLSDLARATPGAAMEARYASLGPDSLAKILFTSGSTGEPKGVVNTQRMLCSNQRAIEELWPFLRERPPVIVDWLPWSHTFGANHNFNLALFQGGTLLIDEGKPTPDLVLRTVQNICDMPPTLHFNVPRGFDMLLPHLERDEVFARAFFGDLDLLFYAAASLPSSLWERLEAASERARGKHVLMFSAWGSTETAPMATAVHYPIRRAGMIGLPAPGTQVKLAPTLGKLELRVKGPNVTPGYFRRPDLTAAAFDDEGFFRMGDAGRLEDPTNPAKGIVFDGRIAEDFKLASATWVHVGALRTKVVAAMSPLASDAVVTGLDRDEVGLMIFLGPAASRDYTDVPAGHLADHPDLRNALRKGLERHNAEHAASSERIARFLVLRDPPSIDAGEITDKGYINQRAVLARRADLVERLHTSKDNPDVVILGA